MNPYFLVLAFFLALPILGTAQVRLGTPVAVQIVNSGLRTPYDGPYFRGEDGRSLVRSEDGTDRQVYRVKEGPGRILDFSANQDRVILDIGTQDHSEPYLFEARTGAARRPFPQLWYQGGFGRSHWVGPELIATVAIRGRLDDAQVTLGQTPVENELLVGNVNSGTVERVSLPGWKEILAANLSLGTVLVRSQEATSRPGGPTDRLVLVSCLPQTKIEEVHLDAASLEDSSLRILNNGTLVAIAQSGHALLFYSKGRVTTVEIDRQILSLAYYQAQNALLAYLERGSGGRGHQVDVVEVQGEDVSGSSAP